MTTSQCVGIDFGTSNSAAALVGGKSGTTAQVLPIDPQHDDPRLMRSVLFFPHGCGDVWVGAEAIARYIADEEGRFIQSVKSFLPSATFNSTMIRGRPWRLAELIAAILRPMRARIEAHSGQPVEHVVMGRPAVFSTDPAVDARAEAILAEAAHIAGFNTPTFVIEPIAAALRYEESLQHDELVLVGDFGAGTSDFTLMQLGPSHTGWRDRHKDIVASGGVYVGGDTFDAAIVEHCLLSHFGAGSTYMAFTDRTELPAWIVRKMLRWHELAILREPKLMALLRNAQATSDDPQGMGNFLSLLEENLGYDLFRAVEASKRALSDQASSVISFHQGDIELDVPVTRAQFEAWSAPLLQTLNDTVDHVISQAHGRAPDAVFLTGGSSKIPAVHALFEQRFGADTLRSGDAFTSVAAGLGRAAWLMAHDA